MPYATNAGVRIEYDVEGTGHPLVLQHGYAGSGKSWRSAGYVDVLKSHYRLILVTARGHGGSDKPYDRAAYTLERHATDVVAVLDVLNVRSAPFWGYSMGGWIGFGMAKYARDRVTALVIGGAQPFGRTLPPSLPDGTDPRAFLDDFLRRIGVSSLDDLEPEIRAELLANDFRALAAAQQDRPSLTDVLPEMTMPCFLYAGAADRLCGQVEACAKQLRQAQFKSFPALDHAATFYRADMVLPEVTVFLNTAGRAGWQSAEVRGA
jgi:pimeloyl-ACP methyl ester carboxylesterase